MRDTGNDADRLIEELIEREGGYVNHPNDKGGPTRFGITERVARAHGYSGAMALLPRNEAAAIYRRLYWLRPGSTKSPSALCKSRPNCSIPVPTWGRRWRRPSCNGR